MIPQLLTLAALSQFGVQIAMNTERNYKYAAAREAADARGKPLLVVGGPWGAAKTWRQVFHLKAHGCGDT